MNKDIKYDVLVNELVFILNKVMNADGSPEPEEREELARLQKVLNKK